jgi:hypothetical protein
MSRPAEYAQAFRAEHFRPVLEPGRRGMPELRRYGELVALEPGGRLVWRRPDPAWSGLEHQPEWVRAAVMAARTRARERIRAELRRGAWWIPRGFTETDLDQLEPARIQS